MCQCQGVDITSRSKVSLGCCEASGVRRCAIQDLAWLHALPAECDARPRCLFGEQDFRAPAPLRKDGEQDFALRKAVAAAAAAETSSLLDGATSQLS